jgi:biopolymer transport protein ExbB
MLLFQDLVQDPAVDAVVSEEKTLSVIDLIVDGGTGSILIISVLFVMLFVALYIYFERIFAIKAASKIDSNFMNQIRDHVSNGKLEAAKLLCAQTDSPVARLTEKGISRIGKPLDDINTAIENAGTLEVYKLEKNVSGNRCRCCSNDWIFGNGNWNDSCLSSNGQQWWAG